MIVLVIKFIKLPLGVEILWHVCFKTFVLIDTVLLYLFVKKMIIHLTAGKLEHTHYRNRHVVSFSLVTLKPVIVVTRKQVLWVWPLVGIWQFGKTFTCSSNRNVQIEYKLDLCYNQKPVSLGTICSSNSSRRSLYFQNVKLVL